MPNSSLPLDTRDTVHKLFLRRKEFLSWKKVLQTQILTIFFSWKTWNVFILRVDAKCGDLLWELEIDRGVVESSAASLSFQKQLEFWRVFQPFSTFLKIAPGNEQRGGEGPRLATLAAHFCAYLPMTTTNDSISLNMQNVLTKVNSILGESVAPFLPNFFH